MKPKAISIFTENELQVIPLLAEGKTAKEIAVRLGRSVPSVEMAIKRMKLKTDTATAAQLIAYLFKNKLYPSAA